MLILGNPNYGLTSQLYRVFPNAEFLSRSTSNDDFTTVDGINTAAQKSLEHNETICVSALHSFWQTKLVNKIIKNWEIEKKPGYLIVIGSSADTPVKGTVSLYPANKKALRAYCRQLSTLASGPDSWGFRITYLSPGNLHTPLQDEKLPKTAKLDPYYVATLCKWLIDQPSDVNISELCLDKNLTV